MQFFTRYLKWKLVLFILVASIMLVVPDILFHFVNKTFKVSHDIKTLFFIMPLSAGLIVCRFKSFSYCCIVVLCILQIMQFASLAYFGDLMSPYTIYMLERELGDTIQEAVHVFIDYAYILLIVCVPFAVITYIIKKSKWRSYIGALALLCTVGLFGYKSLSQETERFFPNGIRFTIYNSVKAFWGYIVISRSQIPSARYKPYEIRELPETKSDGPITIVYIIGESINFRHMSLFGYERDTTPQLKQLASRGDFYYTTGLSGAVSTWAACKFLTSVIKEPDNLQQTSARWTNLFRIAKMNGFKTYYLSNQTEHLLTSIGSTSCIDVIKTRDSNPLKAKELNDEYLFYLLDKQQLDFRKNFIVLHQWAAHTPYSEHKEKGRSQLKGFSGSKDRRIDEYDNAMLYVDQVVAKIFTRFKNMIIDKPNAGKLYVIWTSDHNELLGEGGKYGHGSGALHGATADVPIVMLSNDQQYLDMMKAIFKPTHYELARSVARLLGVEIVNPNSVENVFYINGADYNGKCGYLKCTRDNKSKTVQFETVR
ncbi:MAG: sulfatase-like hydrolase/transferase [Holosporales bacterium]|nr:sulfatase-like hydrolase/transferase [Holosporales bacterium]